MDIKKLNEELEQFLEISYETKTSYLQKLQVQEDETQTKLDNFLNEVDKKSAQEILYELKRELKKKSNFYDSRIYEEDNTLCLDFRDWGSWENPEDYEDEEDYDWQVLEPEWEYTLKQIVNSLSKKYGVKLNTDISEKNWITISIGITQAKAKNISVNNQNKVNTKIRKSEEKLINELKQYFEKLCNELGRDFRNFEVKTSSEYIQHPYYYISFEIHRIINQPYRIWAEYSWSEQNKQGTYTISNTLTHLYEHFYYPVQWDFKTFCRKVKQDFTASLKGNYHSI